MIKGIVFDIGGVLAYDINEYLFEFENCAIVEKYHLDAQKVKEVAATLWQKYAHTQEDHEETWKQLEQEYWAEFKEQIGLQASNQELTTLTDKYVRPVSGMVDFLQWLKGNNFDLLICSNNSEFFFQRQKQKLELGKYFNKSKIILSNHYGVPKSDENFDMFKAVEKQMEYPKETYLFVDDRGNNIDAALQFGFTPVLFPAEADYGSRYIKAIITKINS